MVRYLDSTPPVIGILEQVDIGPLVKAMVAWLNLLARVEVVDVPEPREGLATTSAR